MLTFFKIIEKFPKVNILVIGDMMLDHYIWGDVYRISPEAPVPVVYAERDTYVAGGSANVALNLANLGINTSLLGYSGNDDAGKRLLEILADNDVRVVQNCVKHDVPTIIKTRVVVRNQQLCRIDREAKHDAYCIDVTPDFDETFHAILSEVDAVIISDYAKGVVTQSLVNRIFDYSKLNPDLLISVDPKPTRQLSFKGAGLLTPNRSEALLLAGIAEPYPGTEYPLEEICKRIHEKYEPKLLVVTLGADGMAVCQQGKVIRHLPTEAKEVYDVSGAGDTVIATITAALATGADIVEAAQLANIAAACVVSHVGTAPVLQNELEDKLNQGHSYDYHH